MMSVNRLVQSSTRQPKKNALLFGRIGKELEDDSFTNPCSFLSYKVMTVNSMRRLLPGCTAQFSHITKPVVYRVNHAQQVGTEWGNHHIYRMLDYKQTEVAYRSYCTGSSYEGQLDNLGFSGYGKYVYPHGVEYEGEFKDGEFHGTGTLKYPSGHLMDGIWHKGKLQKWVFKFHDGLEHKEKNWKYLKMPDRSYLAEKRFGFQAAGDEYVCNMKPDPIIPLYTYDNADGTYYSDSKKLIFYHDHRIQRIVRIEEVKQITDQYKQEVPNKPTGYRPEFYERWSSGRNKETKKHIKYFKNLNKKKEASNIPTTESSSLELISRDLGSLVKDQSPTVSILHLGYVKQVVNT